MPLNASALEIGSPGFQTLVQTDRQFITGIFGNGSFVLREGDFSVTPNSLSHAVDISAGKAILAGGNATDQGSYFAWSDSGETIAWPAPSANPRIDTLVLRVADPQYGTVTGATGARWDIIQGVPTASPAARSDTEINTTFFVPGAWLRIADIRLDSSDTGVIPGGKFYKRQVARTTNIVDTNNADAGGTTSTTFTASLTGASTNASATFVAPISGAVELDFSAVAWLGIAGGPNLNVLYWRPFISGGQYSSQTDLGENFQMTYRFHGTASLQQSSTLARKRTLTGLWPGTQYTITMQQKLDYTGPSVSLDDRGIHVKPVVY